MDSLNISDDPLDSLLDFHNTSIPSHLDDSKIGSILSTNSGGGAISPCTRGKTMREFEAELADLRQENFELKMKIYVLEEQKTVLEDERDVTEIRLSHQQLQKELEKVKTELAEKEDLIFNAGTAMEQICKKHEEDVANLRAKSEEDKEKLKETIQKLEMEIMELKERSLNCQTRAVFEDSQAMYAIAFNLPGNRPKVANAPPELISDLEAKILELEEQLRTKSTEVIDLTAKSSTLKLEADQLRAAEANLKSELEFRVQKLSDALSNLASAEKQIQDLKIRLGDNNQSNSDIPSDVKQLNKQYVACKTENLKLQKQVVTLHQRITELEKYNAVDLHKKIDSLNKENAQLKEKIQEMKDEGLGTSFNSGSQEKVCCEGEETARLEGELARTRQELEDLKAEHLRAVKILTGLAKQNRALTRDFERLQGRPPSEGGDCLTKPKKEGEDLIPKDFTNSEDYVYEGDDPEKIYLYSALQTEKQQVEQLNKQVQKRTFDLQELVNKELWSKNKEVERLNKVCEKQGKEWSDQRAKLKSQELEIKSLTEEVERLRQVLQIASKKTNVDGSERVLSPEGEIYKSELESIKSKLETELERNKELESRCEKLRLEAEGWEKSRKDLVNACCLLTTRLEELSSFLESLLPSLAGRKRRLVKEAIDMSREVSKSLSLSCLEDTHFSLSITQPILPDVSQVDFNSEDDPEDCMSSEALEDRKNEMLELRSQMDSLVKRLKEQSPEKKQSPRPSPWSVSPSLQEQKDFSLQTFDDSAFLNGCLPGTILAEITEDQSLELFETDTGIKNIPDDQTPKKESTTPGKRNSCLGSESEGWSEPDRNVSLARIGLKEETPVPVRESESDSSESPAKSNNSSVKKRRDSEVKSLQLKVKNMQKTIDELLAEKSKSSTDTLTNTSNISMGSQLLGESMLTRNLVAGLMDQREKLMISLNQNDFLRQTLEEALSVPSSPTKSDTEKCRSYNTNLIQQVISMTDRLEESCSLCLKLEAKCNEMEKEKVELIQMLSAAEDRANSLSADLNGLKCSLKEKENKIMEKECALLELNSKILILERKVKFSQDEAIKQNELFELFTQESNAKVNELKNKWEKERADLINYYENEICVLKMRLKELEVEVEAAVSEGEKLRGEKELVEGELKIRLDRVEREKRETCERRQEIEGKLKESLRAQAELQARLEKEAARVSDMEATAKHSERIWRRRVALLENSSAETESRLRRKLDQLTLSSSEAVIERTRLANERLTLQRHHAEVKSELERRVSELEVANRELESRLAVLARSDSAPASPRGDYKRQRSNPTSDYTSDHDHHNLWSFPVCGRSNNNSSPDLGIESDNRMSSLEQPLASPKPNGEGGKKLELENAELRGQLARTRQALEDTLAQLNSANQRKRQVEKAICRQLHKTHDILQKARLNLEPSEKHHL